jgi:hypothetical protein
MSTTYIVQQQNSVTKAWVNKKSFVDDFKAAEEFFRDLKNDPENAKYNHIYRIVRQSVYLQ